MLLTEQQTKEPMEQNKNSIIQFKKENKKRGKIVFILIAAFLQSFPKYENCRYGYRNYYCDYSNG
jgi:hypothetical protein